MFGGNAVPGGDPPVVVVDTWDGYAGERQRLLEAIGVGASGGADNLVVLTGDFHSAAVGELRADPFDRTQPVVGVEFMASSISSSFFDGDSAVAGLVDAALSANPQLRFFDARRGYTLCDVTPEQWEATYRAVADEFDEASPVETISTGRSPPAPRRFNRPTSAHRPQRRRKPSRFDPVSRPSSGGGSRRCRGCRRPGEVVAVDPDLVGLGVHLPLGREVAGAAGTSGGRP